MKINQTTIEKLNNILATELREDYEVALEDGAIVLTEDAFSLDEWDWKGTADEILGKLLKVLEIDVDLD